MLRAPIQPILWTLSRSNHSDPSQSCSPNPSKTPRTHPLKGTKFGRRAHTAVSAKLSHRKNQYDQQLNLARGKLLSELSTWRIGGQAKYIMDISNQAQLVSAIRYCVDHSIRFFMVGKGSNCLFDDHGFDGCIMLNRIEFVERVDYRTFRLGAGYPFNKLGTQCSMEGLSGLEFACGIPGTVGGAAFMNAGAHNQTIADVVESVEIITVNGNHRVIGRNSLQFEYRWSSLQEMQDMAAIMAVTLRLTPSSTSVKRHQDYLNRRKRSQPWSERTAGSVFRNPRGSIMTAGEIIEKAGLKGYATGGAKVSEVHANFFINFNNSTSKDMISLINVVKHEVKSTFGIALQEEVCIVPYK